MFQNKIREQFQRKVSRKTGAILKKQLFEAC